MIEVVATPSALAFPTVAVEAKLRAVFVQSIESIASLQGIPLPATVTEQYAALFHLDSLETVSLLCEIESIVGFELKESVVKTGGYSSINEAMGHLMPRIQTAWQQHSGRRGKK